MEENYDLCHVKIASNSIRINTHKNNNRAMTKIAVNNAPKCEPLHCLIYTNDMAIFMVNCKKEEGKNERQHILKLSRPCYDLI